MARDWRLGNKKSNPSTSLPTASPAASLVTSSLHARRSHSRTAIVSVENKSSAPSSKPNKAAPALSKSKQHWVPTGNQHIPLVMQNASQHATPSPQAPYCFLRKRKWYYLLNWRSVNHCLAPPMLSRWTAGLVACSSISQLPAVSYSPVNSTYFNVLSFKYK